MRVRYLKVHFLGAFMTAMLNNQPMGFYSPAVLVKDAQRHGLRVLPIDITRSEWDCTLEEMNLRLGLRYVKGLRAESGSSILRERQSSPFANIDDLARRVPELRKDEMSKLAATGALNPLSAAHRRDALWKSSRSARNAGPLLAEVPENDPQAPLQPMTIDERLTADYGGTGINIGCHPMFYRRAEMDAWRHASSPACRNSVREKCPHRRLRHRPPAPRHTRRHPVSEHGGRDGNYNIIVMADAFDANRVLIVTERWLLVEGPIQNVDSVIHVRATRIEPLGFSEVPIPSHDFH